MLDVVTVHFDSGDSQVGSNNLRFHDPAQCWPINTKWDKFNVKALNRNNLTPGSPALTGLPPLRYIQTHTGVTRVVWHINHVCKHIVKVSGHGGCGVYGDTCQHKQLLSSTSCLKRLNLNEWHELLLLCLEATRPVSCPALATITSLRVRRRLLDDECECVRSSGSATNEDGKTWKGKSVSWRFSNPHICDQL